MLLRGRFMRMLLACFFVLVSLVLAVQEKEEEDKSERQFDFGDSLPVDVVYSDKSNGVTARIPWDSSIFPTIAFLKSVRRDTKLDYGRLIFLVENLSYNHNDPIRYSVLITDDFDVDHGRHYHLARSTFHIHKYRLIVEDRYDMTDEASKQRTFVGVLDSDLATMRRVLNSHIPMSDVNMSEKRKRPPLNEEEMTDEKFLSDYRNVKKGERDTAREVEKLKKLERLEEEYHDRLPKDEVNPVTWEYNQKVQQIEDEYLDSLELPERELIDSRPVGDDQLWDSFESSTPEEEELAMQRARMTNQNWAHTALAGAVREHHIRPGEEFHVFAM